jgi:tRNA nucleotidyltransferase (CCA-adding enzyme)
MRSWLSTVPPPIDALWERLARVAPTYLVGGAVRDVMLGRAPHDWDLATALVPQGVQEQASAWGYRVVDTGSRFGTLTVITAAGPCQVTTFRQDGPYRDRRHPQTVRFSIQLSDDLNRRDFTVNAMALDRNGQVIDPHGGRQDLVDGMIRAVGDPWQRFREDALRMWRAVRLFATDHPQRRWRLAPDVQAAIGDLSAETAAISPPRIGDELWQLVQAPHFADGLRLADQLGLLAALWPSWRAAQTLRVTPTGEPVSARLLATAQRGPTPLLRIAGLLSDPGIFEPHTAQQLLTALALPRAVVKTVGWLLAHQSFGQTPKTLPELRQWRRTWGAEKFALLWQFHLMLHPAAQTAGSADGFALWQQVLNEPQKLAVSGHEIMRWGQLTSGPLVGKWLSAIRAWVDDDPARNTPEQIYQFFRAHHHPPCPDRDTRSSGDDTRRNAQ